jgi:predicted transcriptional regulator
MGKKVAKVKGDATLEHETRRMLYEHITAHPGVSFNVLKRVFDLNDSTLRYHLDYLERDQKISFGLESGKRIYYPHLYKNIVVRDTENIDRTHQLSQLQEQIIDTLQRYPGISQKELVKITGMNRLTLINNINKLMDLCIIRKIPSDNGVCYEYIENEQLKFEILRGLVIKLLKHEISEEKFLELKRKLEK